LTNLKIHQTEGIEISSPVFENDWMTRIIRRKDNFGSIHMRNIFGGTGLGAGLSTTEAYLGKERLPFLSSGPFRSIKNTGIPFKIIV
jgi:hypothetical protein